MHSRMVEVKVQMRGNGFERQKKITTIGILKVKRLSGACFLRPSIAMSWISVSVVTLNLIGQD
jgi:hypothetical protein